MGRTTLVGRHPYLFGCGSIERTRARGASDEGDDVSGEAPAAESLQPKYQNVWSPRYIDALILRDENTDDDGSCIGVSDERVFYLSDANFNVTALVDTSGTVVERYEYDAYGVVRYMAPDFSALTSSAFDNPHLYTGRRLDPDTGLYHYRNRDYDAQLGRFINRDPIGYAAGDMNLYAYVGGSPVNRVDPSGLICDNKCSTANSKRKVAPISFNLKQAQSPSSPGTVKALTSSAKTLVKAMKIAAKIVPGGKQIAKPTVKLANAVIAGTEALDGGLAKNNGVAIWVKVSGECCEMESCCIIWERLDWQKKEIWHKCSAFGSGRVDNFQGFEVTDTTGIAAAVPGCFTEATAAFPCP